jgi:hypothetical protein
LLCGLAAAAIAASVSACGSIGPRTVARDRIDYVSSIGTSWKQQTLLNIVKLRYGDVPIFLEITQVVAGYQIERTVGAGLNAGNNSSDTVGPFAVTGNATAQNTYTDRPTLIYAPLTGVNFLKNLMTPLPPGAVLFLLQSGYSAELVMRVAVDAINGITNESNRGMKRPADPQFARLLELIRDVQLAGALQVRIEHPKDGSEVSMIIFGPSKDPQIVAKGQEIRSILGLEPNVRELNVYYGGYSGKKNEVDLITRSMLQIMLEMAAIVQVPESDVAHGKAAPGLVDTQAAAAEQGLALRILSGECAGRDRAHQLSRRSEVLWERAVSTAAQWPWDAHWARPWVRRSRLLVLGKFLVILSTARPFRGG